MTENAFDHGSQPAIERDLVVTATTKTSRAIEMSSFSNRSKASASVYPSKSSSRSKGYMFGSRESTGFGRGPGRFGRDVDQRSRNVRRQSLKSMKAVSDVVGNIRCCSRD